ncbi:hypothetical protein QUB23_32555, partial [Microcoleus sp. Aus8_D4]
MNKSEANSNKIGLKILKRKNNTGDWNEAAEIILVNRGRKDYLDLRSYTGYPTRIMEKNDAIAIQLVDYGDGLLWDTDFISIDFGCTIEISKKNDLTELTNRLAALENLLNLFGAATPIAGGTNGLVKGASAGEESYLLKGDRTWHNPLEFVSASLNQVINGIKIFTLSLTSKQSIRSQGVESLADVSKENQAGLFATGIGGGGYWFLSAAQAPTNQKVIDCGLTSSGNLLM